MLACLRRVVDGWCSGVAIEDQPCFGRCQLVRLFGIKFEWSNRSFITGAHLLNVIEAEEKL